MPLYEFSCGDCGTQFEAIQSFSATTTPLCVNCQSSNVTRLLSAPAIHFKGSGWYINDSKKSDKQSANGSTNGNSSANGNNGANGKGSSGDTPSGESKDSGSKESGGKDASSSASTASSDAASKSSGEKSATSAST